MALKKIQDTLVDLYTKGDFRKEFFSNREKFIEELDCTEIERKFFEELDQKHTYSFAKTILIKRYYSFEEALEKKFYAVDKNVLIKHFMELFSNYPKKENENQTTNLKKIFKYISEKEGIDLEDQSKNLRAKK